MLWLEHHKMTTVLIFVATLVTASCTGFVKGEDNPTFTIDDFFTFYVISESYGSSVTEETILEAFNNATSPNNRRNTHVEHALLGNFSSPFLTNLSIKVIQIDNTDYMYQEIYRNINSGKGGHPVSIFDHSKFSAQNCKAVNDLIKIMPSYTLLFSPCNYDDPNHSHVLKNGVFIDNPNAEIQQLSNSVFNGLDPHSAVDFALALADKYNWFKFQFVMSPEFRNVDNYEHEITEYFEASTNAVIKMSYYCTRELERVKLCNQKNHMRRLVRTWATFTFVLLETEEAVEFLEVLKEDMDEGMSLEKGKALVILSMNGASKNLMESILPVAIEGVMVQRKKVQIFSDIGERLAVSYGDPFAYLYEEFRITAKAIDVYMENQHVFEKLSALFCDTKYFFSESPNPITRYNNLCVNRDSEAEIWNVKRSPNTGKLYYSKVYEVNNKRELKTLSLSSWLGSGEKPPVENVCELEGGPDCPTPIEVYLYSSIVSTLVLATGITVAVFLLYRFYKNKKTAKETAIDSVITKFGDVEVIRNEAEDTSSTAIENSENNTRNNSRMEGLLTPFPNLSDNTSNNFGTKSAYQRPVESKITKGKLKGRKVVRLTALPTSAKTAADNITDSVIEELIEIKKLRHRNINPFIGIAPDAFRTYSIHEYCPNGSLADVLARKTLQLNRVFKVSFLNDIASGMTYLHQSSVGSHGQLTSENVLVDARWFCKISNIPIPTLEEPPQMTDDEIQDVVDSYNSELPTGNYWTAPEFLRIPPMLRPVRGSQSGDVYAFGILICEVITRLVPYESNGLTEKAVLTRVRDCLYPPFRPMVLNVADELRDLLELSQYCWEEVLAFRPSFTAIVKMLKKATQGYDVSGKLVDEMIATMENYAENLESIVSDRTQELTVEQQRSEELLAKMLPRSIIEKLKNGTIIKPETYYSVTVYFSAVVGFTELSATSSPLEIVDFLNDLYSEFDEVIELYDVYKVETISDAYMVASGLPIRIDNHVTEIADMALDILSRVTTFVIKHRPGSVLQLRIGIHTGPVVAGIVGLKMPRYCLFGDTVNYASRMESSGLALRIHVSPETKDKLDKVGGYYFEKRGFVAMKGKGKIETYHLLGKDGFDRMLPDLSLAAPIESHRFK